MRINRVGPLKIRAQIMCGDEPAIGPGKVMVLEAVDRAGSISAAGRDIGMSYRRIWMLVDSMNRCWKTPLIETATGGSGGAKLTDLGRSVLKSYKAMNKRIEKAAMAGDFHDLVSNLRDTPIEPAAKARIAEG